jgi:pyruvate dehydrogenase E2 component (dihydrolipoyllysine-residue acetyltransferase)
MRRAIAARMSEAKRSIPHFRLVADIQIDELLAQRKELLEKKPDRALSLNDLLIKACAQALSDVPDVNVQWAEKELHRFHAADIAVVTAVKGGLTTPILRAADSKSIWQIAAELKELTARAARNELRMEEIVGGSFSISNLGMYAVDQFDAIINPPQCAILAVGQGKPRCVALRDSSMGIPTIARVTLSVDHRAIDGVVAAQFLSALKARIETPSDLELTRSTDATSA